MKYLRRRRVRSRAGGRAVVQGIQHDRRGPAALGRDHTGQPVQLAIQHRRQQLRDDRLAFAADDRVERPVRLVQHVPGDEGHRVAAREYEATWAGGFHRTREIDDLRDVGQVVEAEPDRVRREVAQVPGQLVPAENLEVEEPDLVTGGARGARDPFQAQRFEPEEDLRVHQPARVNQQRPHEHLSARRLAIGGLTAPRGRPEANPVQGSVCRQPAAAPCAGCGSAPAPRSCARDCRDSSDSGGERARTTTAAARISPLMTESTMNSPPRSCS